MDMTDTIVPKSDQLNADDLLGRELTITVTKVAIPGGEQPVTIHYDGDGGRPYKPGKSMRRVLVSVWGPDANAYVGRSMTLYRDDEVVFGGLKVGGIRISHMSHTEKAQTMALTATRGNKKAFTIKPLKMASKPETDPAADYANTLIASFDACQDQDAYNDILSNPSVSKNLHNMQQKRMMLWETVETARKRTLDRISDAAQGDAAEPQEEAA